MLYFIKPNHDKTIEGLEAKIKERDNSEDSAEIQAEKVKSLLNDVKGLIKYR